MTLDIIILEKCLNWTFLKIGIEKSLIDDYAGASNIKTKRDIVISIIESIQERFFKKFKNSFSLLESLKMSEEDFLFNFINYRDHFLHSLQIFLLGCFLINEANLKDLAIEFLSNKSKDRFIRIWFLISIYHDIGYFSQKLITIGKKINELHFKNISGVNLSEFKLNISEDLDSIFLGYLNDISKGIVNGEEKYFISGETDENLIDQTNVIYNELKNNYDLRNHGIISALFLQYTLNLDIGYIAEGKKKEFDEDIKIACTAIASHDLEKQEKIHLDFHRNPFASLLILLDNIQEWDRPKDLEDLIKAPELWRTLEINAEKGKDYVFHFVLNEIDDFDEKLNIMFDILQRIFSTTIINGYNFEFVFQMKNVKKQISITSKDNNYEIKKIEIV